MELIFYLALIGVIPTFFAGGILGLIASRRGYKYISGFGYGALVGIVAYLPWAVTRGWTLVGLVGAVLGVLGLVVLSRRKFPKVIKPYEKRT